MEDLYLSKMFVELDADYTKLKTGFDIVNENTVKTEKKVESALSKWATLTTDFGKSITNGLTKPLISMGSEAVSMFLNLESTTKKVDSIFGSSATAIEDWANTSIENMGIASQSALDSTIYFGQLSTGIGFTTDAAADMGMELTQRAADLAYYNGIQLEVAQAALTGVFTGEAEGLEQLGVSLSQANLNQFALEQGLLKTTDQMSEQELVALRLSYVLDETSTSAGAFAANGDTAAGQLAYFRENVKELGVAFGSALLPQVNGILKSINKLITGFNNLTPGTQKLITGLLIIVAAAGPVLSVTGKLLNIIKTLKGTYTTTTTSVNQFATSLALQRTTVHADAAASFMGATAKTVYAGATGTATAAATAFGTALNIACPILGILSALLTIGTTIFDKFIKKEEEAEDATDSAAESYQNYSGALDAGVSTKAFDSISSSAKNANDSIIALTRSISGLPSYTDAVTTDIDNFQTALGNVIFAIGDTETNISNLETAIGNLSNTAKTQAMEAFTTMALNIIATAAATGQSAEDIEASLTSLRTTYTDLSNNIDTYSEALTGYLTGESVSTDDLQGLIDMSAKLDGSMLDFTNTANNATEATGNLNEAVQYFNTNPTDGTLEGMVAGAQQLTDILEQDLTPAYNDIQNAINEYKTKKDEIVENADAEVEAAKNQVDVIDKLNEAYDNLPGPLLDTVDLDKDSVSDWAKEYLDFIDQQAKALGHSVNEYGTYQALIEGVWGDLVVAAEDSTKKYEDAQQNYAGNIENDQKINAEEFKTSISEIFDGIDEDSVKALLALHENGNIELDETTLSWLQMFETFGGDVESLMSEEGGLIVQQFIDSFELKNEEFKSSAESAGYDFSKGFADGILSGQFWIENAAAQVISSALKKAKDTQESKSPSKATKRLGKYFVDGFVQGIQGEITPLVNSVTEVFNVKKLVPEKLLSSGYMNTNNYHSNDYRQSFSTTLNVQSGEDKLGWERAVRGLLRKQAALIAR